jgi:hypothetical protein
MAGYKRKLYHLTWPADHELHGLEVTTTGMSIARYRKMTGLSAQMKPGDTDSQVAVAEQLCDEFARCLTAWNLEEDDGTPVPATRDGIAGQDMDFVLGLISSWTTAVAGVGADTPLPGNSSDGDRALEASLPMEPLSLSQAS